MSPTVSSELARHSEGGRHRQCKRSAVDARSRSRVIPMLGTASAPSAGNHHHHCFVWQTRSQLPDHGHDTWSLDSPDVRGPRARSPCSRSSSSWYSRRDARASLFSPEVEDKLATIIALFVLFVVPVVLIVLFWLVHVLPEKIAHQRHHPQFEAIRTLVPALSAVRRVVVADGVDVGVFEARLVQDGLRRRHDGARGGSRPLHIPRRRRRSMSGWPASKSECRARSSRCCARTLPPSRRSSRRGRFSNGNPAARHLLVLRLAHLHQAEAAAVDDAVEGRGGDLPDRVPSPRCSCCS